MVEAFTLLTATGKTLCFVYVLQTLPQKKLSYTLNRNRSLGNSFWKSRAKYAPNIHNKCYSKGKV